MSYISISVYRLIDWASMMVSVSKLVLPILMLLTIFVAFQFKGGKSGLFHEKVHMHISNNLTNGVKLTVHCKDKNHDIGVQTLNVGESYNFVFRPNSVQPNTLYFCGFRFNTEFHYFDVYDQSRDDNFVGRDCQWDVHESGPCRHNVLDKPYSIECFPWNPSRREGSQRRE
jgi:hypothetical protein